MKQIIVKINTYEETIKLGELLATNLYPSSFIALSGDLGAGKTTFTKGIGKVLGVKRTINSPTFTIMKNYPTNNFNDIKQLYHLDVYRLTDSMGDFELEEYFYLDGVTVVEWCDIISDLIPDDYIRLDFKITDETKREITITEFGNVNIIDNLKKDLEDSNYEIICR